METTMRYLFPLTAVAGDGRTTLIYGVAAFRDFARTHVIGERFAAMARVWDWRTHAYVDRDVSDDWIVRDDRGRVVTGGSFGPHPTVHWRDLPHNRWRRYAFRDGPVPGVHGMCHQRHDAPRKRHGGRGVAARSRLLHSGDPLRELD